MRAGPKRSQEPEFRSQEVLGWADIGQLKLSRPKSNQ
jgi:hypothetical protein